MSKAKVRSMQRGAQKRSSSPKISMHDIYKKHPPRIATADKPHLDFLKYGKIDQAKQIKTVIEAARKNGIGSAAEISRLLNKLLITTAIGEKWTPRLAWFAASAVRSNTPQSKNLSVGTDYKRSQNDTKFRNIVNRVVKSRLEEIESEFAASRPTLSEAAPELLELKKRLSRKT
ncbi:hypothetical protein NBRC116589_13610 [Ruegeria sp. HU-ET01832]|uniref:hypothetical protein n=1 Tax=Ruegeria sp. HU-ET01832 TaxID=3135906 RepID=UPI0031097C39